ncbi:MAG TPA: CHASE domain-containing protein [Candidatus Limnocylindrales bacterium]|nr:CHASE domain-containing protein [Candidatus Limnocylindrales bacterium]
MTPAIRRSAIPFAILFAVAAFSLVAARLTWTAASVRDQARFENAISSTKDRLEGRVQVYIDALTAAAAYVDANPDAGVEGLSAFLKRLGVHRRYPGVQGLGFAERIEPERLAERTAEMRAGGFPTFRVWPDTPRDRYTAIVLLEPLDRRNRAAIGYDMSTEPVRREAMDRARDTASPAMSGRVMLVQEIDQAKQAGFLIYVPVYRTASVPTTVEERRRELRGYVYAPFRAGDLLRGIFGREREPRVAFRVYAGDAPMAESLLAREEPAQWQDEHSLYRATTTLTIAGAPWTLEFSSLPAFDQVSGRPLAWLVGIGGTGIGLLLFGLARAQEHRRRYAEDVAATRKRSEDRLRMITDTLPVLVAYVDAAERYIFANGTYRSWLDLEPHEIEGRTLAEVLGPDAYAIVAPRMKAALAGDMQAFTVELPYRTGKRHVRVEYVPHRENDAVVGVVSHVSDVTEAAQAARERMELLARERAARNEAETLNRIGRSLAAELETEKLVQIITDESTRITGAQFGAFFRNAVDAQGGHYLLHTLSGAMRDRFDHLPPPRATAIFAPTFAGAAPVRLDDVRKDPRFGRNAPYFGLPEGHLPVVSYLAVPVVSSTGEVFGGLFFGHAEPGKFTEEHERIVVGIAGQASIALDNARLYEAAKEADRRKDEFLAMLAHELRNPLAPIVNSLQVMKLKEGDAEARAHARSVIDRQVHRMVRLVDDLLDVSRITRGKIQLRREVVDLRTIAERAVEATRSVVTSRRHRIDANLSPKPVLVLADPVRLEQVLTNLLDNAAKYTESGGQITINVRDEESQAVVEVRDTGIGIPRASLPHMFDLFVQADRTLDRAAGGLGIGLTLVRRLVELHDGRVDAHSDGPGTGSTFVVRLPLARAVMAPAAAAPDAQRPAPRRRLRVLVVDDNADITGTFCELLWTLGHEVRTADSGPAALEVAREFAPQLVLLDIGLPGMSGYEVAQRLRRQPELSTARIVAVSGYAQESDRRQARSAGFDDHLAKPVDFARLEQILSDVQERAAEG